MTDQHKPLLSAKIRAEIDHWIMRYPPEHKRSGVMEALRFVQDANGGSLTTELMDAVADYLDMPKIAVYEVVSFYSMYFTKPVGRHVINVCTSISCMLAGSDDTLKHCEKRLGIGLNQTTSDGKFTLREVECLAGCVKAPIIQVGKKYHEQMTPDKIDTLLGELE